ncbi:MAG: hypothetical protein EBT13_14230 [Rhodobacteraceae bacterium]|nr:hypothetical protein [Paracoccaceae bacterium]
MSGPEIEQARDRVVACSLADLAETEQNGKDDTRLNLYTTTGPTVDERVAALESRVDQALRRLDYMLVLLEKICAGR